MHPYSLWNDGCNAWSWLRTHNWTTPATIHIYRYTHKMCIVNSNADSAKLNCRPVTEFHIYYANVNINLLWWTTMYGMTGWRCWMLDAGCCWYYWCPIECRWFGWDAGMSTNLGLLFHDRLWWLARRRQCNDHRLYPPAFIVSTE